jgi:hypothetical protein
MRASHKITLLLGTLFAAGSALAQSPGNVQVGTPSYSGNGCPAGSLAASISPDGLSLSILFSAYQVNTGGSAVSRDRKSCALSIPVSVPPGYQMMINRVDYRGFALLPQGSLGSFDIRYAFTGMAGLGFQQTFSNAQDGNFTLSNIPSGDRSAWTPCGMPSTLQTTTNLMLQSNPNNQQASIVMDSADMTSGLTYQLRWATCTNQPPPNPPTQSACRVMPGGNAMGARFFRVIDRVGRIILTTPDYQQALRFSQTDARCFQ